MKLVYRFYIHNATVSFVMLDTRSSFRGRLNFLFYYTLFCILITKARNAGCESVARIKCTFDRRMESEQPVAESRAARAQRSYNQSEYAQVCKCCV